MINSKGQLGVTTSSASYKENVKPMEKASEEILSLQPVTFHCKKGLNSLGTAQFGLVAEEVAKVAPELVARIPQGAWQGGSLGRAGAAISKDDRRAAGDPEGTDRAHRASERASADKGERSPPRFDEQVVTCVRRARHLSRIS